MVDEMKPERVLISNSLEMTLPSMQTSHLSIILFIALRIESILMHFLSFAEGQQVFKPVCAVRFLMHTPDLSQLSYNL